MADSRTSHFSKAVKVLGLFSLLLLIQKADSFELKVGGSGDWSVPSDPNAAPYAQWAQHSRFRVGDTLLFTYPADKDSVLQVTKDAYENCNTKSPLVSYSDGHTVYKINQSGPHYFISGVEDHCKNNEKLEIVVMGDRSKSNSSSSKSPPSPAPSGDESPPPPSSLKSPPSPAPSGDESPAPPSGETNPAPAPSQVADNPPPPPRKNGGSSIFVSSICSIGAFIGSSILLVF